MKKLHPHYKRVIKLIYRDQDEEGWTMVSNALYPHLSHNMPKELVEFGVIAGRHRARLTEEGVSVLNAMRWL